MLRIGCRERRLAESVELDKLMLQALAFVKGWPASLICKHLGKEGASIRVQQIPVFASQEESREVKLACHTTTMRAPEIGRNFSSIAARLAPRPK